LLRSRRFYSFAAFDTPREMLIGCNAPVIRHPISYVVGGDDVLLGIHVVV
jgi:hypothetical protein